jgi:DNA-binding LytR/AlgR family response regulator
MVLTLKKVPSLDNDYVEVQYRELTSPISQIIDICNHGSHVITGSIDDKKHPIDISDILYVEWVDGHSCICTAENVYTTPQSLANIEQFLDGKDFVRASKPILVNIRKVKWVSSALNMKLTAELTNGERIAVSRHYRENLLNKILKMGKEMGK